MTQRNLVFSEADLEFSKDLLLQLSKRESTDSCRLKVFTIKPILYFPTSVGTFYIVETEDRLFHPVFEGRGLGAYREIWQAVKDLAENETHSVRHPSTGESLDTSKLGIPQSPEQWKKVEKSVATPEAAKS